MSQNRNLSILADNVSAAGVLNPSGGGLGIATTPANGQIPIGNGTNYTAATLAAGTGIDISNSAGGITVTNTGIGPTVPTPGTSGNVMTSDGTNWTSAAPAGGASITPYAVGSYAFCFNAGGATYAATVSGASVLPAAADGNQSPGAVLSGTWQCMGYARTAGGSSSTTLYVRIA